MRTGLLAAACAALLGAGAVVWVFALQEPAATSATGPKGGPMSRPAEIDGAIAIKIPEALAGKAALGATAFAKNCAACHGDNAAGSKSGPPLVHVIYEPSHHGDGAFFLAAKNGVRAHHWRFGDMPPLRDISDSKITTIVAYVRRLQQENGIR